MCSDAISLFWWQTVRLYIASLSRFARDVPILTYAIDHTLTEKLILLYKLIKSQKGFNSSNYTASPLSSYNITHSTRS